MIGLDFVRDWEWCLGVWILSGFAAVFFNSIMAGFAEGENPQMVAHFKVFLGGPLWFISLLGTLIGFLFHR